MIGTAEIGTLALRFIARHGNELRPINKRWNQWNGSAWEPERTLLAFNNARIICRDRAAEMTYPKDAMAIRKASTVAKVVKMVEAMYRHPDNRLPGSESPTT
jgi:putative DNA primase/helicase